VGWSDGGIVGLLVAMARPDLVRKLVAISANFDTSGGAPGAMEGLTSMTADSDDLAAFRTSYEAASPEASTCPAVVSMPRYSLNIRKRPGALDAGHHGVGPHKDLCPDERGRGRAPLSRQRPPSTDGAVRLTSYAEPRGEAHR
jgi:pimeloyl-ACP methyl ester carboxylesterase